MNYSCAICGVSYLTKGSLTNHIFFKHHITSKEYYDKFLSKPNEKYCLCGNEKPFKGFSDGYHKNCNDCKRKREKISIICKVCNQELIGYRQLTYHLRHIHKISKRDYYVNYLNNPIKYCPNCEKELPFRNVEFGFASYCSHKCRIEFSDKYIKHIEKNIKECRLCGKKLKYVSHRHLRICHNTEPQEYYDKFFKKEKEGVCVCGNNTEFISQGIGYRKYCSNFCSTRNTVDLRFTKKNRILLSKSEKEKYKYLVHKYTKISKKLVDNIELKEKGYELDHKFSISQGRRQCILPWILAIPLNLEIIPKEKNQTKLYKCSITKKEIIDEYLKNKEYYGKLFGLTH